MLMRPVALLLALALPASAQVRAIVPSTVFAIPAVRLAPPVFAPLSLAGTLSAPSLAPSLAVPMLLPPAFADGRAFFERIWAQGFEPPEGSTPAEFLPEGAVPAPGDAW